MLESIINTFRRALSFTVININHKTMRANYVSLSDISLILIKYKEKKDKRHFYDELVIVILSLKSLRSWITKLYAAFDLFIY